MTEITDYCPLLSKFRASSPKASIPNGEHFKIVSTGSNCRIVSKDDDTPTEVHVKFSPLIDPIHYLAGKTKFSSCSAAPVPSPDCDDEVTCRPENSSYVDGYAYRMLSDFAQKKGFVHAPRHYASLTGRMDEFALDLDEDVEYVLDSSFFNKNEGNLFKIVGAGPRRSRRAGMTPLELGDVLGSESEIVSPNSRSSSSVSSPCSSRSSNTFSGSGSDDESESCEMEPAILIKDMPVHAIIMEKCSGTLDELLLSRALSEDQFRAAIAQVCLSLAGMQKGFGLTHNDLHTNNIMYVDTDIPELNYRFDGSEYKVPTFGRIYKIIDFGRAIYTVHGETVYSDSFFKKGDAATQYNTGPFYNPEKARVDPNFSFDLCRLGCSLCEFATPGGESTREFIDHLCRDDKGRHMMHKSTGEERYPDFKLYKMIARSVHNKTPSDILTLAYFNRFRCSLLAEDPVFDIDALDHQ